VKTPRDWNGEDFAKALVGLGFARVLQTGSHIQLRHDKSGKVISIPAHRPLKVGLLAAVSEMVGLSRQELIDKLR
jgi:predicted RNA binding protein YcfA (HicA-like mRNA interferase family)